MRSSGYLAVLRRATAYRKLVVTGSERSGTTICARMLGADLGFDFVDETDLGDSPDTEAISLIRDREAFVLQMPNLLLRTDTVAGFLGEGALGVVVMRRPYVDVEASRRRIGLMRRNNIGLELRRNLLRRAKSVGCPVKHWPIFLLRKLSLMEFRQMYVEHYLRHLPHFLLLDFNDLNGHPMYVPSELRRTFRPKQTAVDQGSTE